MELMLFMEEAGYYYCYYTYYPYIYKFSCDLAYG